MRAATKIGWKVLVGLWVLFAVGVLLSFRSFSEQSASMMPTLRVGDYMAVYVPAYGLSKYSLPGRPDLFEGRLFARDPKRGDIAVFALPRDPRITYVKRIIGLPGDTIQMKEGRLWINGTIVPREPIAKVKAEDYMGREADVATYRETLPGDRRHEIIELQGDTGFNDTTEVFKVPAGSFFAMSDNRDSSVDSRVLPEQGGVGYVPFDNLIGRVELVFLAMSKDGGVRAPLRRVH